MRGRIHKDLTNYKGIDYLHMKLSKVQFWSGVGVGLLYSAGAAFLFYRSFWGMLLTVFFIPFCLKRKRSEYVQKRKECLLQQFKAGMQIVSGSLAAGYSMENAWKNAQEEMERLYGRETEFCLELNAMNQKIRMNEPMEKLLFDFAYRTGIEDICNFAEIFRYARRSGGDFTAIIRATVNRMQEKTDILEEIQNAVAAKRAEQKMMNVLLPGILLFITFSSPEYVDVLYQTAQGVLSMSICLGGYLCACRWSEKIMNIQI